MAIGKDQSMEGTYKLCSNVRTKEEYLESGAYRDIDSQKLDVLFLNVFSNRGHDGLKKIS